MRAYVKHFKSNIEVEVDMVYDGMDIVYKGNTVHTYECADGVDRNFTGQGVTLLSCLRDIYLKAHVHKPVAKRMEGWQSGLLQQS